jgi:hypothetical protein
MHTVGLTFILRATYIAYCYYLVAKSEGNCMFLDESSFVSNAIIIGKSSWYRLISQNVVISDIGLIFCVLCHNSGWEFVTTHNIGLIYAFHVCYFFIMTFT